MAVEIRPRAAIEADLADIPRLRAQHMGAAKPIAARVDRLLDELWAVLPPERRTQLLAEPTPPHAPTADPPRCAQCGTAPDTRRVTPDAGYAVVLALCECDWLRCPYQACKKPIRATAADVPHACPHCKGRL